MPAPFLSYPCPHSFELQLPPLPAGASAQDVSNAIESALVSQLTDQLLGQSAVLATGEMIVHVKFGP